MISVVPFAPVHIDMIDVQPAQRGGVLTGAQYAAAGGDAWTAFANDGRVLFCGGLAPMGLHYVHAWAVLATRKLADLWPITRTIRQVIADGHYRRVEMYSEARFDAGARWALALGFELEGVKRAAMADGGDLLIWAIVRPEYGGGQ